jgi:tetratricopeptide (TPR) repeat protein
MYHYALILLLLLGSLPASGQQKKHNSSTQPKSTQKVIPTPGDFERAQAEYQGQFYADAVYLLDKLLRKDSTEARAYWLRARCHFHLKKYTQAAQDLQRAVSLQASLSQEAEYWAYAGWIAYHLQAYNESIFSLKQSLELDFNNAPALSYLGAAFMGIGQADSALHYYQQALEISPMESALYIGRGQSRMYLEDYRNAVADFDRALQLNYLEAEAYRLRARARFLLNDAAGCLEDFRRLQSLYPGLQRSALEYSLLAGCHWLLQRPDEALAALNQAIALAPENAWYYFERAQLHLQLGNTQSAWSDAQSASQWAPQEPCFWEMQADMALAQKDYVQALALYEHITTMDAEAPKAYHQIALLKALQKAKKKEVKAAVQQAQAKGWPREDFDPLLLPFLKK